MHIKKVQQNVKISYLDELQFKKMVTNYSYSKSVFADKG